MKFFKIIQDFFQKPKLLRQLLFWFLIIALPTELFLAYMSYHSAKNILKQEIINNLKAISVHQVGEVSDYLYGKEAQISTLAGISDVIKSMEDYDLLFKNNIQNKNENDTENYKKLDFYQKQFGYLNLFLVNQQADVVFSLDSTFSKINLRNDIFFRESELNRTFERCLILMQTDLSDFSYQTQTKKYALFISTPIYKNKKMIGVLIAEIDPQEINQITGGYAGLGKTGEVIIGIKENQKILFVNDARNETGSAFNKKIPFNPQIPLAKAILGEKGDGIIIAYRGIEVIAKWDYIPSLRAGIVVKIDTEEAFSPTQKLRDQLFGLLIFTLLAVITAAYLLAKSIAKPIVSLTSFVEKVGEDNSFRQAKVEATNEIGTLTIVFNKMIFKLKIQHEALENEKLLLEQKVKERTVEIEEQKRLLQMELEESTVLREEITEYNEELNQINEEIKANLDLVQEHKNEIEIKTKKLTDSINYAYRIQISMLPSKQHITEILPDSFVFFKPKDIVSGDFYWFADKPNCLIIAAVDCTGHGVPGAFMSMIANDMLNQIVHDREIHQPNYILAKLHELIKKSLKQDETQNRDGMDISVICMLKIEDNFDLLTYAGAMNPLYYIQEGIFHEIKADKKAIGGRQESSGEQTFSLHQISLNMPTTFYLCSDGFQDQFGGKENRKFMVRRFKELLFGMHEKTMLEQEETLNSTLTIWKKGYEQVDDILVIGVKVDGFVFDDNF